MSTEDKTDGQVQAVKIAEELMSHKEFKTQLIRAMVNYLVNSNTDPEVIKKGVMTHLRDTLDREVNSTLDAAKEAVRVKAKNYVDHNVLQRMDTQLEQITSRFTPDYVSKLIMEQFTEAVRDKCMDTEVSFKLRDVLDGPPIGRRYYYDDD